MVKKLNLAGRILLTGISLAGLLKVSGCETTPAQSMAVGSSSAQYIGVTNPNLSAQQGQSLGAIGGLLGILAQQEAMKEAAVAGKSEIVVNVNVPEQQDYQPQTDTTNPEETILKSSFVCRGYKDLNEDGSINTEKELIGVGNYFKCGNEYTKSNPLRIVIGSKWSNIKGQSILTKITQTKTGGMFLEDKIIDLSGDIACWDYLNWYKSEQDRGIEEHRVEFYQNGRLDQSKTLNLFIDYGED